MTFVLYFSTFLITTYVSLLMGVVIFEVLASLLWQRKTGSAGIAEMPETVVLIPSHNEEEEIAKTLQVLSEDLPEKTRLLCVAHNCSDSTADIARKMGADVLEVSDSGTGGKPDALKAGLRSLDDNPPEVVVVIDADCSVGENAIRLLATQVKKLGHPVMGAYFFAAQDNGHQTGGISSLALLLKNFIRPLGLHRLRLPCLLNGSGSAYPFEAIRSAPHGEGSIAEDYQLTLDLLDMGFVTTFLPEARVDGRLPRKDATAQKQRRRWEHGHLYLSFNTAPRAIIEGLLKFQLSRLVLGLDLLVPPLAYLAMLVLIAGLLNVANVFFGEGDSALLYSLLVTLAVFVVTLITASVKYAGVEKTVAAFSAVPRYLIWKLPIYLGFFKQRETRWMKTERD